MKWLGWLRGIAYLKRIALALERLADSQHSLAQIAFDRQARTESLRMRVRRIRSDADPITTFESLDQEAADRLWAEMQAERGEDVP